jgi:hypothetical protein
MEIGLTDRECYLLNSALRWAEGEARGGDAEALAVASEAEWTALARRLTATAELAWAERDDRARGRRAR